jgi:hypothetical protein
LAPCGTPLQQEEFAKPQQLESAEQ